MDFSVPRVMGIINVTPDSFYASSRTVDAAAVSARVAGMVAAGVDILDVGGYSTRPGAPDVSADEDYARLARGLEAIHRDYPDIPVSVDTFRAGVARRCVEDWNVDIINDIGGGTLDPEMWDTVADLGVAYVLMHIKGTPQTMQSHTDYDDVAADVLSDLARKAAELHARGVADVILDPGFGFAKTVEQNYRLLSALPLFRRLGMPVLAGLSHKTMIWKPLGITPAESTVPTVALDAMALQLGADVLRVHEVEPAVQTVKLFRLLRDNSV
ncbi:MAG: dihydropteroate synthase [Muribaculaceae bacterium]|nr:dihydropteroate synthase [Muribaculaceae bacterium]